MRKEGEDEWVEEQGGRIGTGQEIRRRDWKEEL